MTSIEIKNEVGVDPKKLSNTTDKIMPRINVGPKEVRNTAILIVGCTGAGKSTLGNWLLDVDVFKADSTMGYVTRECQTASIQIGDREFILIDTPGIFDAMINDAEHLSRIDKLINLCSYGIQAIILVLNINNYRNFEGTVRLVKEFLGDGVAKHMIVAFSGVNKKQTEDNSIEPKLNSSMKNFLKTIQNRWIISPNPDIFNRDDQVVKRNIANAKEMIFRFRVAYNLSDFKEVKLQKDQFIGVLIIFILIFISFILLCITFSK